MTDDVAPLGYSIQTKDLNLWYGDFQALKNVRVDIRQGLITALIGPSGCGKTTLLRSANRLNERYGNVTTTGEIRILGRNIYDPKVSLGELRKTVGMVFQRPNPLPISIYENVIFGLRVHHGDRKTDRLDELVESSLKEVQLWNDVRHNLHQPAIRLTLEQQQKLCIARLLPLKPRVILMDEPCSALDARLLPLKPRVILMDEPCSALDAEGTAAIERLMDSLREKYTIVIVTHNMAQARRVSDECIFMLMGEVVEQGPTTEVFLRPKKKNTELYVEGRYG